MFMFLWKKFWNSLAHRFYKKEHTIRELKKKEKKNFISLI